MEKIILPNAPAPLGPYSPALKFGDFIQVSGQIPLKPDGTMVDGSVADQTRQVMENLKALIETAGGEMSQVVKCTCYLSDMTDFSSFNEVYGSYFTEPFPCRATVQAQLPAQSGVEVDALVYLG